MHAVTRKGPSTLSDASTTGQLHARLATTKGEILVALFPKQAPQTVTNFVELAEGSREWRDPNTSQTTSAKLYDGTIFHRVISGFMLQGGDPLGNGRGGPGYEFGDEFDPSLRFDRPYLLAMANAGPGTNGSQFFITVGKPAHLNDRHTIFGEVVAGHDVVDTIEKVPTNQSDRPLEDVVVQSVTIERG